MAELLEGISSREISGWIEFYRLEAEDAQRQAAAGQGHRPRLAGLA